MGLRALEVSKLKRFPASYDDIIESRVELDLGPFEPLIQHAVEVRTGLAEVDPQQLFKNLSFLNSFVQPELLRSLATGDQTALPEIERRG